MEDVNSRFNLALWYLKGKFLKILLSIIPLFVCVFCVVLFQLLVSFLRLNSAMTWSIFFFFWSEFGMGCLLTVGPQGSCTTFLVIFFF